MVYALRREALVGYQVSYAMLYLDPSQETEDMVEIMLFYVYRSRTDKHMSIIMRHLC